MVHAVASPGAIAGWLSVFAYETAAWSGPWSYEATRPTWRGCDWPGAGRSSPSSENAASMVIEPNFGLVYQRVLSMNPSKPTTVGCSNASDDVPVSWLCMLM